MQRPDDLPPPAEVKSREKVVLVGDASCNARGWSTPNTRKRCKQHPDLPIFLLTSPRKGLGLLWRRQRPRMHENRHHKVP